MDMQRLPRMFRNPSPGRALLVAVATVLMVIVGLVGMHTLSVGETTHGVGTGNHGTATQLDVSSSGNPGSGTLGGAEVHSGTCDDNCQSSTPGPLQHTDVMMACALALLVGFIFLLPIAAMYRTRTHQGQTLFFATPLRELSPLPRPPSLIVLSISRT